MTAGILTMEAGLVAPVTEACAGSGACLSPSNEPFLGELVEVSWQSIPYLSDTAGSLVFALAFLAVLGWRAVSVRAWEAALIVVGSASTRPIPSCTATPGTGWHWCCSPARASPPGWSAARSRRPDVAYRRGRDQGVSGFGWSSPSTQMSARSL